MRNLTFITTHEYVDQAACFRSAFMDKTAVWNVSIAECASTEEADAVLDGKEHAYVVCPEFRSLLVQRANALGASSKLTQGADLRYRGGSSTITLSQVGRSVVDLLEDVFIPIYGSKVVVLGSGTAGLDMVYECSRAGVDKITVLDKDKTLAEENLSVFLDAFGKNRMSILDTDQSIPGHVTATKAYDHTEFSYGSFQAIDSVRQADIIISLTRDPLGSSRIASVLKSNQIVCDPWGHSDDLISKAQEKGCDVVVGSSVMERWAAVCSELLIEFSNAGAL